MVYVPKPSGDLGADERPRSVTERRAGAVQRELHGVAPGETPRPAREQRADVLIARRFRKRAHLFAAVADDPLSVAEPGADDRQRLAAEDVVKLRHGLAADNLWIVAGLVPTLIVMHYGVISREERYLERRFGEEYLRYKGSVRRWV